MERCNFRHLIDAKRAYVQFKITLQNICLLKVLFLNSINLLANIGLDTAENERSQIVQLSTKIREKLLNCKKRKRLREECARRFARDTAAQRTSREAEREQDREVADDALRGVCARIAIGN